MVYLLDCATCDSNKGFWIYVLDTATLIPISATHFYWAFTIPFELVIPALLGVFSVIKGLFMFIDPLEMLNNWH